MTKKIRVGIVGTGSMAKNHADSFAKLPGVELVACMDTVKQRAIEFAQTHGFKDATTDLRKLLKAVDAISVVTPDRFHAEITIAALRAGKHVFCEKPLTATFAEAREVAAAARVAAKKYGAIHMINFSKRNASALTAAMKVATSGKLGALRHVHGHYLQCWLSSDCWGNWSGERWLWRLTSASGSGGVLADLGCHILDMATAVAGRVNAIRCELRTFPKILNGKPVADAQGSKLDANDTAIIELDFANGAIGVIHTTRWATGYANRERIEVHGTEGALIVDLAHGNELQFCLGADRHKPTWTTEVRPPTPSLYHDFIQSIHTGKQAQPDMFRGAEIQAYLDACARSAKSGKWESVAPVF